MPALNGGVRKEMFTPVTAPAPSPRTLALRGRVFRAVSLSPTEPVAEWLGLLDAALARSPKLFEGKQVILDVVALPHDRQVLTNLISALANRSIRISGIEGAGVDGPAGLPPFLFCGKTSTVIEVPAEPEKAPVTSLTIEGSVRSGQSIVHPEGDVTVMGSVSSGAEILAGGSIHVYGALRGRAIAGAAKNPRARIYCRKFEPELLGIDRLVRTAEDMGSQLRGQAVQIWQEGGAIKFAALG